ncbi:MAG: extracellular solute-binding protein [Bryobacterales bacterium]|nr:extracellular solute-binding protein [Bryobacterales bacterium]
MIHLSGITWNHTRGYLPVVATAQRFSELNPEVAIQWDKRSLQQFADEPVEKLAERFDLLVIDHPFAGYAAEHDVLLPLDEWLPGDFLDDQQRGSVGRSFDSYTYRGHQWALAIDAAAPVSGWRRDLLERAGAGIPRTWSELLALARRGLVAVPGLAIDSLMHFYMLCGALGEEPFLNTGSVCGRGAGVRALEMLRELLCSCGPGCLERNPPATWELLASGDSAAYCPFAYGYSNYGRPGYSGFALEFGGLVEIEGGRRCRSTLGGAGLAISARCRHPEQAAAYARFTAAAGLQRTLYFQSGGQPGHRSAWTDREVNRASGDFFLNTLETLDSAWLRPRFNGYLRFQDAAAPVVHEYLRSGGDTGRVMERLDALFRDSLHIGNRHQHETT